MVRHPLGPQSRRRSLWIRHTLGSLPVDNPSERLVPRHSSPAVGNQSEFSFPLFLFSFFAPNINSPHYFSPDSNPKPSPSSLPDQTNFTQTYTTFWDHALGTVWSGSEADLAKRYPRGDEVGKQWAQGSGCHIRNRLERGNGAVKGE